jgi:NAD(P)-dependent dehydrogenase (short-subunit alcohol dehydrogenase family)
MANYLITGSSRGLGLALATELCTLPPSTIGLIFATARSSTPSLQALIGNSNGRVVFVELDATNEASVNDAIKHVESVLGAKDPDGGLDVLINNAGVMPVTAGGVQEMTDLDQVLRTNVSGVQMVTRAFLPLLRKGREKKVFNM